MAIAMPPLFNLLSGCFGARLFLSKNLTRRNA
jgi:hypothetical protein